MIGDDQARQLKQRNNRFRKRTPKPTLPPTPPVTLPPTPPLTPPPTSVRNVVITPPPPPPPTRAILLTEATADLQILACDDYSVEINGTRAGEVSAGMLFINIPKEDDACPKRCNGPLLRKVTASTNAPSGRRILTTTNATFADILGPTLVKDEFKSKSVEAISPTCFVKHDWDEFVDRSCSRNWLEKNYDGFCINTDCFVGTTGNPNDCFECKLGCDQGCVAKDSILTTDGYRLLSAFSSACCDHDHCWSSKSFGKAACDERLYQRMQAECPSLPPFVSLSLNFTGPMKAVLGQCDIFAYLFAKAVASTDLNHVYDSAQQKRVEYESTEVCVAKCPISLTSQGWRTTVFPVNMNQTNGTFLFDYDFRGEYAELYIEHEQSRIFQTGLSRESATAAVSLSGLSSVIKVHITEYSSFSDWKIDIKCPNTFNL